MLSINTVFQIKYQACPDIQGSESKGIKGWNRWSFNLLFIFLVERMTCIAKWKEGNKRYFVALVSSRQSKWVEQKDRYQCFLYEDISNKMKMAQGQFTSTCQGLWSVLEGSRTFSLQKCMNIWKMVVTEFVCSSGETRKMYSSFFSDSKS